MTDDIVARLRTLTDTLLLGDFQGLAATTASAADEIERLRAERDEARCDACVTWAQFYRPSGRTETEARKEAKRRGWDCFEGKTNGK